MALFETLLASFPIDQYGLMAGFFYPVLLTLTIFLGALEFLHVFKTKINVVLALVFTALAAQSPVFGWFATQLVPLGGYAAILMFVSLFMVGTVMWGHSRARHIYYTHGSRETRLQKVGKEIDKLQEKLIDAQIAGDEAKIRQLSDAINKLNAQREVEARKH